jgi:hypothetical protein
VSYVLSTYVDNLLLYEGRKVHLRYYVLLLPSRRQVWLCSKGHAFHADKLFDMTSRDMINVHLTNACEQSIHSHELLRDGESIVIQRLSETLHVIFTAWFAKYRDINDAHVFSILAIDVLVDQQFQPYILEFNASWDPIIYNAVDEQVECRDMLPAFVRLVRNANDASCDCCVLCYK